MAALYGNDALLILVLLTKKKVCQVFGKSFRFLENLFQNESIKSVQNFHWLAHKNLPIYQTEGYFENPWYRFLEKPMHFLLALKWNL